MFFLIFLFFVILALDAFADYECIEDWNCTTWSSCYQNNTRIRTCNDLNECGTDYDKPEEIKNCTYTFKDSEPSCQILWYCGPWSDYCSNNTQYRTCEKLNDCLGESNTPETTRYCDFGCYENWKCSDWEVCQEDGTQTRICIDKHKCGTEEDKPIEVQECTYICLESWMCTNWSECSKEGYQTRICTDQNSCETTYDKPIEVQECTYICDESWQCTNWSDCIDGQQTRICTDQNSCETTYDKPNELQECSVLLNKTQENNNTNIIEPCIESWSCTDWGACLSSNTQTRTCIDLNECDTKEDKPLETQNCIYRIRSSAQRPPSSTGTFYTNTYNCENRTWECMPASECIDGIQEFICKDITDPEQCDIKKPDIVELRSCSTTSKDSFNDTYKEAHDIVEDKELEDITGFVVTGLPNESEKMSLFWPLLGIAILSIMYFFIYKKYGE